MSTNPDLWIIKQTSGSQNWLVGSSSLSATDRYLILDSANSELSNAPNIWSVSSSKITFPTSYAGTNNNTSSYIAYCFASKSGYSKVGSYTGTGASGNFQYVGFEPSFVMIKSTGVESWYMMDNKRLNGVYSDQLYANLSNAEGTGQHVDFTSNGFQLDTTDGGVNNGSASYIFIAIA